MKKITILVTIFSFILILYVLVIRLLNTNSVGLLSIFFCILGGVELSIALYLTVLTSRNKKKYKLQYKKTLNFTFMAMMTLIIGYLLLNAGNLTLTSIAFFMSCTSFFLLILGYNEPYIAENGLLYYSQLITWSRIDLYIINDDLLIFKLGKKKITLCFDKNQIEGIIKSIPLDNNINANES